jgi:hypothetical protein
LDHPTIVVTLDSRHRRMSRSGAGRLTVAEFAERLEQRLKGLSAERLRSILLSHGERLSAGERAAFLEIFEASPGPPRGGGDLLADVARVVADPPAGSSLAACWGEVDHCASAFAAYRPREAAVEDDDPLSEEVADGATKPLSLTPALRAGMAAPGAATRARLLAQGAALARARAEAIVSNKNRGAYERAARLWNAVQDAHVLAGLPDEGARLFDDLRDRLSRNYRFRERLDAAVRRSSAAIASAVAR